MNDYLLFVSIGPVQDFIAAARRTRDLYYGSWLLSELAKTAARTIAENEPAGIQALIFPSPNSLDQLQPASSFSAPNKLMAEISSSPMKLTQKIEAGIDEQLRNFGETALTKLQPAMKIKGLAQIMDLIEFYWAAVPLESEKHYSNARQKGDRLLAARKVTRDFKPHSWGANVPKSSIDGIRESIIPESAFPSKDDSDEEKKIEKLYNKYKARPAEQLSGVDLLKRLGSKQYFPSTSHVAAKTFFKQCEKLKNEDAISAWQTYYNGLPKRIRKLESDENSKHPIFKNADGSLLFENRLVSYFLRAEDARNHKQRLQKFYQKLKKSDIREPLPYYALLLGDGDSIGKVLNHQDELAKHCDLSKKLGDFAGKVPTIVEKEHEGALVYAGGDDVLALLPLHTVLKCAKKLADSFKEVMKEFTDEKGNSPTFSAGILITHHLEPLSDALALLRKTEKVAKAFPNLSLLPNVDATAQRKNALAITLDKRSGVPRTVVGRWGKIDERLKRLIQYHQNEQISAGLAYEIQRRTHDLGGEKAVRGNSTLQAVLDKEIERILSRKREEGGGEKISKEIIEDIIAGYNDEFTTPASMSHELIIAAFLAQATPEGGTV